MGLCILAGGSVAKAFAAVSAFTLAWTHSVEKIEWQEDWRIAGDRLVLVEAHVHGHGAGMEPPDGARFDGSGWSWQPNVGPLPELILRRSATTSDWRLCIDGDCRDLATVVGAEADPVRLVACPSAAPSAGPASVYNESGSSETEDKTRAR
jgi:hypothetical protein